MSRKTIIGSFLLCVLVLLFVWTFGFWDFVDDEHARTVLFSIRLPRVLLAALCGASLSAAGVISQGLFQNPLASPSVLGASSGGVLGAILVYYFAKPWLHWFLLPSSAFLGTLLTLSFVLMMFKRGNGWDSAHLLICGFVITTFLSAVSSMILAILLPQFEKAASLMQWMMGGFSGRSWEHLAFALPGSVLGFLLSFSLARKLDVLSLGDEMAGALNVQVRSLQRWSVIAIALLVGSATSVAGALPFVGLIVPHISRGLVGSSHRVLLPFSILNGMLLIVLADFFAQRLLFPRELDLGSFTSLLGVGFFFWLFF